MNASPVSPILGSVIELAGFLPDDIVGLRQALGRQGAVTRISKKSEPSIQHLDGTDVDVTILCVGGSVASGAGTRFAEKGGPALLLIGGPRLIREEMKSLVRPACQFILRPWTFDEVILRIEVLLASARAGLCRKTQVVVVDDDASITNLLQATLSQCGLECHVAGDGEQGLAMVREVQPKVVVLDVGLPSCSGFDILSSLRSDESTRDIRILMLTGYNRPADIGRGLMLGADGYMIKPFNPNEVAARVRWLTEIAA